MENYAVDLEIAKELKENGFPQESYFDWLLNANHEWIFISFESYNPYLKKTWLSINKDCICSAPTSEEILKELPNEINGYILKIERYENGTFEVDYYKAEFFGNPEEWLIHDKRLYYKLSNALAEMWIKLKKEGYIK